MTSFWVHSLQRDTGSDSSALRVPPHPSPALPAVWGWGRGRAWQALLQEHLPNLRAKRPGVYLRQRWCEKEQIKVYKGSPAVNTPVGGALAIQM